MSSVDNRAVHMTFDNQQFEKNLADTMKSMDALKKSLDFANAKKSFADLGDAAHGFNLNNVGSSVEGISNKFLALGTIAITTLANITNRAVDAGIRIAKSLTVGPIGEGFSDYNSKLTSVQTITNATGETVETVSGFFDQLDTYADKTVFNLSDMTSAFAKFTNAGIDMDVAVPAIKGIANMTALAGQGADAAAIGMYNLSQSLAGGFLTTTDYKSLNLANIATKQWKDYMIQAAVAAGTLKQTGDDTFEVLNDGSNTVANSAQLFNNELSRGWANADILIDVLGDFGDTSTEIGKKAQSAAQDVKSLPMMMDTLKASVGTGWTDSFEIILGNLDESKALFTEFTSTIQASLDKSADWRNNLLQGWKDLGGRTKLIEGIKDMFGVLQETVGAVGIQFHRFFGSLDSQSLYDLTEKFANFMASIRNNDDLWDRLYTAFGAIFAGLKIGTEIVKGIIGVFADLFQHFVGSSGSGKMLDFIDRLALAIIGLEHTLVDGGGLDAIFAAITDKLIAFGEGVKSAISFLIEGFKNPGDMFKTIIQSFKDAISEIISIITLGDFTGKGPWEEDSPIVAGIFKVRDFLVSGIDAIKEVFQGLEDFLNNIFGTNIHIEIPQGIKDFFSNIFGNVDDNTSNSIDVSGGMDRISSALGVLQTAAENAKDAVGWIFDKIEDLGGFVVNAGGGIIDFFENLGPNINDFVMSPEFDKLLQFMQSLGILMGGAGVGKIAKDGLAVNVDVTGGALTNLGKLFKTITDMGPSVQKNIEGLTGVFKSMSLEIKAKALLKIAEAIGLITASVLVLSFIDPEALGKSLTALAVGFGQLIGAMALLNAGGGPKSNVGTATTAGAMIAIAAAVLILSGAVAVLAQLSWQEIGKGLTGVTGLLVIMAGAAKILSGSTLSLITAGVGMTAIAVALTVLAGAMKLFATMSWEEMGKGLAAVAGGLLIIAGALQLMPASTILIGPGLLALGVGLNFIASALLIFATMSWQDMGKGMTALLGSMLILSAALDSMGPSVILVGPGLIAVGVALNLIAASLLVFAKMSWEDIGKSMTALLGSLLILSAAMESMSGTVVGAAAIGIAAVSLMLLAKALKEFAKMSWKELGKGLLIMTTALTALGLAAYALAATGATAAIIALGIALLALGAGFFLLGAGASLLAESFQIMAAAGTAGIDVLMYAIDQFLIRLPDMANAFVQSIVQMADMLLAAAPGLISKLSLVIGELLQLITDNADDFAMAATAWILAILKVIRDSSPDIIKTGMQLLTDFLKGIEKNVEDITATVAKIIVKFTLELASHVPELAEAGAKLLVSILGGISDHIGDVVTAGIEIFEQLLIGLAQNIDDLAGAVGELITRFIEEIGKLYSDIAQAGTDAFIQFMEGMGNDAMEIIRHAARLVGDIIDAIVESAIILANRMADALIALLNGLTDAIETHDSEIGAAARGLVWALVNGMVNAVGLGAVRDALWNIGKSLASKIKDGFMSFLQINSPSLVFMDLAGSIPEGIVKGLDKDKSSEQAGADLAARTTRSFQQALNTVSENLLYSDEFHPTITPVLDLTQVQTAAGTLGGLLNGQKITPDVSIQGANQLLAETAPTQDEAPKEEPVRALSFTQINNSPEALTTARIYKNTRSQIEIAKKELENV